MFDGYSLESHQRLAVLKAKAKANAKEKAKARMSVRTFRKRGKAKSEKKHVESSNGNALGGHLGVRLSGVGCCSSLPLSFCVGEKGRALIYPP
ncbi:hypothetical protein POVWA2_029760 [Plasmodium ovale wallikeri]|uniref:Uncharacterized protein n=1 Tax=Plasmodium ovale wallikeri TaxID=864142 RepID=A0A1A8YWQ4_PLAOA|nr:hypothetical protein POVWA1_030150 [Plasmodium ovale wallikeri]SBT36364.1 hypothetical protein POVWA2_029760 [Plasmodium ovale wallikeri]